MIGIVVATHGELASGIESALTLLAGKPSNFETVELHPGKSPDSFGDELRKAVSNVDDGDGALILLDIFGGTPSNISCQLLCNESICAITGVNLPMVIEAVFGRNEETNLEALVKRVRSSGSAAVLNLRDVISNAREQEDEEDF